MKQNFRDHPRWPLYKKLRRHVKRELEARGQYFGEHSVDFHLTQNFQNVLHDLRDLFNADLRSRGWR